MGNDRSPESQHNVGDTIIYNAQKANSALSQVVAEKSLTEKKKFTDRQTNIVSEKAKTVYPLYTSYRGIIIASAACVLIFYIQSPYFNYIACFR